MKDLYTFDRTNVDALATYANVRRAYSAFFDELKLPYIVADADSGSIGGDISHEYHIASPNGEDNLLVCGSCQYAENEERTTHTSLPQSELHHKCPKCDSPVENIKAIELGHTFFLGTKYSKALGATVMLEPPALPSSAVPLENSKDEISSVQSKRLAPFDIEMGCHGIGVSRLIAAVADRLADSKGLNWPRVIAPFDVVIIPTKAALDDSNETLNLVTSKSAGPETAGMNGLLDAILDDRSSKPTAWKLKDADLIGYPIIVVLGNRWKEERLCEVQCRRLDFVQRDVVESDLHSLVHSLLEKL